MVTGYYVRCYRNADAMRRNDPYYWWLFGPSEREAAWALFVSSAGFGGPFDQKRALFEERREGVPVLNPSDHLY